MNAIGRTNLFHEYKAHLMFIQTDRLADLLVINERESESGEKSLVAQVGQTMVAIRKNLRRSGDPLTELIITQEDLRRLVKEATRSGWNLHCKHLESLDEMRTKEIRP